MATRSTIAVYPNAYSPTGVNLSVADVLTFVIPSLQCVQLQVIGILFGTDICLLALLPLAVAQRGALIRKRPVSTFLAFGALWLASQMITDAVRHSSLHDYARGWSMIILTLTHFVAIALLIGRSRKRVVLYGTGLAFGIVLGFFIHPIPATEGSPWKFVFAFSAGVLVALLAAAVASSGRRIPAVLLMLGMALFNLLMDYRSMGLICLLTALFTYLRLSPPGRFARIRTAMVMVAGIVAVAGFVALYTYWARTGYLGAGAKYKYEQQTGGGGLLLGGRSELLASSAAIADSPLLGHGSWAKDPKYAAILKLRRLELGYKPQYMDPESAQLIPTHSHLFGAWVDAGILGAVFWVWVLWVAIRGLFNIRSKEPLFVFLAFVAFQLLWDILFSPYGAERRFVTTYFIYIVMTFAIPSVVRCHELYVQGFHRYHLVQSE